MIIIEIRKYINNMELPTDAILGDTIIEIIGKNTIYIENYKRILEFCETGICIQCRCYKLSICGKCLNIAYYNKVELKIMGVIDEIKFC